MTTLLEPPSGDDPRDGGAPQAGPTHTSPTHAISDTGPVALVDPDADFPADTIERASLTDPRFPVPPERSSLDDDVLVPLVERHSDDTATIDLIAIVQAQMVLRQTEAARFAAWEHRMRTIGTDAAFDEIERTRLHFTGVVPVQTDASQSGESPETESVIAGSPGFAPITPPAPGPTSVDAAALIHVGTAPTSGAPTKLHPTEDEALLESGVGGTTADDETLPPATHEVGEPVEAGVGTRIRMAVVSIVAAIVVAAALVTVPLSEAADSATGLSDSARATIVAIAVAAAAWLGAALARVALGRGVVRRTTARTVVATLVALVVGTAVGEGITRVAPWQGYLLRLADRAGVDVVGIGLEVSVVVGVVASALVAFVLMVLVERRAPASRSVAGSAPRAHVEPPLN